MKKLISFPVISGLVSFRHSDFFGISQRVSRSESSRSIATTFLIGVIPGLTRNPVTPVFTGACFALKVIPAKAGIQFLIENLWIPAFAGMTAKKDAGRAGMTRWDGHARWGGIL